MFLICNVSLLVQNPELELFPGLNYIVNPIFSVWSQTLCQL